ncbi:MAG TPA: RNA 2',3'-cyclic phosphodiesterase [Gammaproteobacteria bacterium]
MSSPLAEQGGLRLFFALWPDEAVRLELVRISRQLAVPPGAKRVVPDNLHLTMAFIGTQGPEVQACLEEQAAQIQLQPFSLTFDQLGFFAKPQVVWLGDRNPPQSLLQLAQALKQAQLRCGLEPETRPFQTHLTLLRKVRHPPAPFQPEPISWPVQEFVLVASETLPEGAQYRILRRFSLHGG